MTPLFSFDSLYPDIYKFDWSYQSNKIAFIFQDEVYIVNSDGSGLIKIPSPDNIANYIAWSKTEDILAYAQLNVDHYWSRLFEYDYDTGQSVNLEAAQNLTSSLQPLQWSADGSTIAFGSSGRNNGIFLINRDGTQLKQIYDQPIESFDWYSE